MSFLFPWSPTNWGWEGCERGSSRTQTGWASIIFNKRLPNWPWHWHPAYRRRKPEGTPLSSASTLHWLNLVTCSYLMEKENGKTICSAGTDMGFQNSNQFLLHRAPANTQDSMFGKSKAHSFLFSFLQLHPSIQSFSPRFIVLQANFT